MSPRQSYTHSQKRTAYTQLAAQSAFTLIELMIVVAIIGVLAAVAFPTYSDFQSRSRISEVVLRAGPAKLMVTDSYEEYKIADIALFAAEFNASIGTQATKFVASSIINPANGEITLTSSNNPQLALESRGKTIILTPQVRSGSGYQLLSAEAVGVIDWACSSTTKLKATARGMITASTGTMPSRYVPPECR